MRITINTTAIYILLTPGESQLVSKLPD